MRAIGLFAAASALGLSVVVGLACDNGMPANSGLTEPILVHSAQFVSGPLPGATALDSGLPLAPDGGPLPVPPLSVTTVSFRNPVALAAAAGKSFSGTVTNDSAAVGVALEGLGTGYWVLPVGGPDPSIGGQNDFSFQADFAATNPPGRRQLLMVGIDSTGKAGRQFATPMCLLGRIPDNDHECEAANPVPRAVFTLMWDTNFDLDIHVITPDGIDVNPKNPVTMPIDGGVPGPQIGTIDRDSIGHCIPDGLRQEDLVFQDPPQNGTYLIYANPFDSCGQAAVRFNFIISEPGPNGDLQTTYTRSGELLQQEANGGSSIGLFVVQKTYD